MSAETQLFVEFTTDVGSWKAGGIESLKAPVARGLIEAGQAKESDSLAYMRASLDAANEKRFASLKEEIVRAIKPDTPKGPPGGKELASTVAIGDRIEHTKSEGRRSFTEMLNCVFVAQCNDAPEQKRTYARNLLGKVYSDNTVSYKTDDAGTLTETIERGGVTVMRTGTESISGGPTYGFAIKPDWATSLFRIPIEDSVIEGAARDVPVGTSLEFKWPALDQWKTPIAGQSAAYAGFQLFRKGEITQRTASDAALSMIEFKITDLTAYTTLSRDLLADNYIQMDATLVGILGEAFQWKKDYEFINGNGIGAPVGYFNSNVVQSVTRGTSSKIEYEDLVGMMKQIHSSCYKGLRWVANTQTIDQLVAIKNHAGTYVYQPNAVITQVMEPTVLAGSVPTQYRGVMMGIPVHFTEKVPTLGTKGDLSLIHPQSYGVANRSGLEVAISEHFLFDTDTVAFRFKIRNDAKPLWRAPYLQSDGGNTTASKVGPFSVLN